MKTVYPAAIFRALPANVFAGPQFTSWHTLDHCSSRGGEIGCGGASEDEVSDLESKQRCF
jgi:hypothetical protein